MLKKILIIGISILIALFLYLTIGYFTRAITQPTLLGIDKTYYFFGFYILAMVYSFVTIALIITIIILCIKFKKRN